MKKPLKASRQQGPRLSANGNGALETEVSHNYTTPRPADTRTTRIAPSLDRDHAHWRGQPTAKPQALELSALASVDGAPLIEDCGPYVGYLNQVAKSLQRAVKREKGYIEAIEDIGLMILAILNAGERFGIDWATPETVGLRVKDIMKGKEWGLNVTMRQRDKRTKQPLPEKETRDCEAKRLDLLDTANTAFQRSRSKAIRQYGAEIFEAKWIRGLSREQLLKQFPVSLDQLNAILLMGKQAIEADFAPSEKL